MRLQYWLRDVCLTVCLGPVATWQISSGVTININQLVSRVQPACNKLVEGRIEVFYLVCMSHDYYTATIRSSKYVHTYTHTHVRVWRKVSAWLITEIETIWKNRSQPNLMLNIVTFSCRYWPMVIKISILSIYPTCCETSQTVVFMLKIHRSVYGKITQDCLW